MFELYSDDIKSEYSSNSKDIFKYSTKKIYIYICIYIYKKNFAPMRQPPNLLLLNVWANFLTERKYLMNNLAFVRQKYL